MIIKTFALVIVSLILMTGSVFAIRESTPPGKTINLQDKINTRVEKLENKLASREAKIAAKMEDVRAKIASKEALLKSKLSAFRDQKKATAAARISTNLNKINENQTSQMQKRLERMSVILDKLQDRVASGKPDIKNTTGATTAIADAIAKIASASSEVGKQAEKDYTIQVTTESRIRIDAKRQRDLLHTDLQTIRKLVIEAKQAVANAIRTAKSGQGKVKEGTTSGQQ